MKNLFISVLLIGLVLWSCNPSKTKGNLTVKGTVRGLRQGTLLLKKMTNDSLKSIDSILVDGNEKFLFQTDLDEAQMMLLELPEVKDGRIVFFASPKDTIKIFAYLESFGINPIVSGGENQKKYQEYKEMIQKFNDKELDLFKAKFDATKNHLLKEADSLDTKMQNLSNKRILYTLNYIFNHKDMAISPYIAITEFYKNPKALDTIYKVLNDDMKNSLYGKQIAEILEQKRQ